MEKLLVESKYKIVNHNFGAAYAAQNKGTSLFFY